MVKCGVPYEAELMVEAEAFTHDIPHLVLYAELPSVLLYSLKVKVTMLESAVNDGSMRINRTGNVPHGSVSVW